MSDLFKSKRALKCVTDGRVISLAELQAKSLLHGKGSGFAVLPPMLTGTYFERFLPQTVRILSPADGVITAAECSHITLRTGDGILITVLTEAGTEPICTVGAKVNGGGLLCTIPRKQLLQNGMEGAVAVLFPDTGNITELHVISGIRKAGYRTAFYRILPPK